MNGIVVKIGGHALDDRSARSELLSELADDIVTLQRAQQPVALVHGGGPQIKELLDAVGIESSFYDGLRVTDEATMRFVAMALSQVNVMISAALNSAGLAAVGLSGADATLLTATALGEPWLRAGATPKVRSDVVTALWAAGYCPVVSSIAVDESGDLVNCNADTAAGALAGALDAQTLVLLSDIDQVRSDPDDSSSGLERVNVGDIERLLASGAARDGMVPKLRAALDAMDAGASRIILANGTRHHALRNVLNGSQPSTEVTR